MGGTSQTQAAEMLNVSERSIQRARAVLDHGIPELARAVERSDVAVSAAAEVARHYEPEEQERLVQAGPGAVAEAARCLRGEV